MSKFVRRLKSILEFLKEFWLFMRVRKKWWLTPLVIVLFLISILIILTEGSALAPFIYTIF